MLHPQAHALIDLLEQRGVPPTHTLTPAEARAFYRERRAVHAARAAPRWPSVRELQADGPHGPIPLRLYRPPAPVPPRARRLPVLVYYHGGGWTIGDLDTHDVLCRQLCNGSGCAVVAVDYRMGPEHRFPAAVDDCLAATRWVRRAGRRARRRSGAARGRRRQRRRQPRGRRRDRGARCRRPADRVPAADLSGHRHARASTRRTPPTARATC